MNEATTRAERSRSVTAVWILAALAAVVVWVAARANGRLVEAKLWTESMTQLHAASAHFPIALLLSSAFFDAAGLVSRRDDLRVAGFWSLLAGTLGAVATVVIGFLGNPFATDTSEIAAKVMLHQRVGVATAILFGLLTVWRVARGSRLTRLEGFLYTLVTLVGIVVVSVTGYLGGHLLE
jgi:uncharacterized membrane protein